MTGLFGWPWLGDSDVTGVQTQGRKRDAAAADGAVQ